MTDQGNMVSKRKTSVSQDAMTLSGYISESMIGHRSIKLYSDHDW